MLIRKNKTSIGVSDGFTLIEIVIVLAIAAIIMVVVFLAITGAQRSQRDAIRKDIAQRTKAQLESAKSNNGGAYPAVDTSFADAYMSASSGTLTAQGIQITWDGTNPPGAVGTNCPSPAENIATINVDTSGSGSVLANIGVCLEVGTWYRAN